jgi:hypothetical protein
LGKGFASTVGSDFVTSTDDGGGGRSSSIPATFAHLLKSSVSMPTLEAALSTSSAAFTGLPSSSDVIRGSATAGDGG